MDNIYEIREDLRMCMIIAAFVGISWFIGVEIITSLLVLFKRPGRGLYFWSCALSSWGIILQSLFIILADFGVWTDLRGSITMIYLTWFIMVIPQSWLLYSRLHLLVHHDNAAVLRWLKVVLLVNSIVFSVPTIVIGTLAQATTAGTYLYRINLIWDRVQLTVFFSQETFLSALYIYYTRKYLRDSSVLSPNHSHNHSSLRRAPFDTSRVLHHLIYTNLLVIALDIALLGVQYADLFYLQGAFKPCVYGVKLKAEFSILNRLIDLVRSRGGGGMSSLYPHNQNVAGGGGHSWFGAGQRGTPGVSVSGSDFTTSGHPQKQQTTSSGGGSQYELEEQTLIGMGHLSGGIAGLKSQSQESRAPIIPVRECGA